MVSGFSGRGQTAGMALVGQCIAKDTLLLSDAWLSDVWKKAGMGCPAVRVMSASLAQAQCRVYSEAYIGGVIVFLTIIFPPTDRTQCKRTKLFECLIPAAWAAI